ncbi:MAG: hypothetical protein ACUVV6_07235 [Thermoplasmatota archaeon]
MTGAALGPRQSPIEAALGSRPSAVACLILIPVLLGIAYSGGANAYLRVSGPGAGGGWDGYAINSSEPMLIPGSFVENSSPVELIEVDERYLASISFTLRWRGEDDIVRLLRTYENRPDEFGLAAVAPSGTASPSQMVANEHGEEESVSIRLFFSSSGPGDAEGDGTYEVTIFYGNCGDFFPAYGVIEFTDTGNEWTHEVSYEHYVREPAEGHERATSEFCTSV